MLDILKSLFLWGFGVVLSLGKMLSLVARDPFISHEKRLEKVHRLQRVKLLSSIIRQPFLMSKIV